jgi:hypothetical protein
LKTPLQEDLTVTHETLVAYMVTSGIRVFSGSLTSEGSAIKYVWDEGNTDWKEFIDTAKDAGAPCVAVKTARGTGSHSEDLGFLELSWSKDGVIYSFAISAPWWGNAELKGDWVAKSDEELVADIITFGENAYRKGQMPPMDEVAHEFWESRGVSTTFSRDPELKMRITKVSKMAEAKAVEKDRELAGMLVGDAVEWIRGRRLRLADRQSIDEYVAEKGVNLSTVARDELRQMVNYRLSTPSF